MFDGVINIYKEKGYTSHDVVAKMRGILKQKKIGHTGTLDPEAEGVLPVCLGKATKLCDMLTDKKKTYEAVLLLGVETDTQDTTGIVVREGEVMADEDQILSVIAGFLGKSMQIPPMYSALKVNGKRLYELARQGKEIEREARPIEIYEIAVKHINLPRVTMTVTCSKGTYIRTICHDIGDKLGCGGCMAALVRSRVSRFDIADSLTLAQVEKARDEGKLPDFIIPVDQMFPGFPSLKVGPDGDKLVHNGNPFGQAVLRTEDAADGSIPILAAGDVRVYDSQGTFIGVYSYDEEKRQFYPRKMFLGGK